MPKKLDIFPVLTVDPGWNTGWAYWENSKKVQTGQIQFLKSSDDLMMNFKELFNRFEEILDIIPGLPTLVIIESVELWGSSTKSYASTATGSLFKLAYLIGGYTSICITYGLPVKYLPFREWGGQLSPNAVRKWVQRVLQREFSSQHIYDAVAMGLSYFERFNKNELRKM